MTYEASSTAVGSARFTRVLLCTAALSLVVAAPRRAEAGDPAAAEMLFREGMTLFDAGKYAEACAKLGDSQRLDPASGTLLALALCHEREGKLASAWGEYLNAAALARRDGRAEREQGALKRAAELEPQLARLTIRLDPAAKGLPGVEVRRNGEPVPPTALDTALPVDEGEHVVEARADGKQPIRVTVRVPADGAKEEVTLPPFADAPAPETGGGSGARSAGSERGAGGEQGRVQTSGLDARTLGFIVGGVGIAALGAGAFFGLSAISDADESKKLCPSPRCSNPAAIGLNDDAEAASLLSNVFIGAGILATGAGAYLVLTAPKRTATARAAPRSTSIAVRAKLGAGSFALEGAF